MTTLNKTHPRNRQQGVTLVELMVALLLGLLLTAGMIQVFAGNRATYAFNDSLSRIQENARFTLDHIAYNARMAGYSGCLAEVPIHDNLNDDGENDFRADIENGIQGHDANGTGDDDASYIAGTPSGGWTPDLPTPLGDKVLAGSDVLIVRSIGSSATALAPPFNDGAQLFVDPPHDFKTGEILVVSDCQKASVFQATDIDKGTTHNVVHSGNSAIEPGNHKPVWGPGQEYGLGSELSRLQAYAFYVGQGQNGPTLFQLRLNPLDADPGNFGFVEEELAEGIETMQVRYGLDLDNDGAIDRMVSPDNVTDWLDVLSVEISLLARATEEYGTETDTVRYRLGGMEFDPVDDRRLRQVFTTSIGVRNRLP